MKSYQYEYITEVPEPPSKLRVMNKESTLIELQWTPPFDGNSPITKYLIEYKVNKGE